MLAAVGRVTSSAPLLHVTTVSAAGCRRVILFHSVLSLSLQYEGEDKVVAFTGEYKDEDIVKFIQGEQLALFTKFSDEVSCLTSFTGPFFFSSFPFVSL